MGDEPTKAEGHRARSGPPALAEAKCSCPPPALLTTGSGSASSGIGLDVFMQRLSVCLSACLPFCYCSPRTTSHIFLRVCQSFQISLLFLSLIQRNGDSLFQKVRLKIYRQFSQGKDVCGMDSLNPTWLEPPGKGGGRGGEATSSKGNCCRLLLMWTGKEATNTPLP